MSQKPEHDQTPNPEASGDTITKPTKSAPRGKQRVLSSLLLIIALGCLAAGSYLIARPYWVRHKQMEIRGQLIEEIEQARFDTIYVDPNANVDPGEEVEYFVPDGEGGYVEVTMPSDQNRGQSVAVGTGGAGEVTDTVEESTAAGEDAAPIQTTNAAGLVALNPLGRLVIPKIAVDIPVVENLTSVNLRYAACHYQETVDIGAGGNAAVFAHRSPEHGRDLNRLNEVVAGDRFTVESLDRILHYLVEEQVIVKPAEIFNYFGRGGETSRLVLVTCHPIPSWENRLLVVARLERSEAKP